MFDIYLATGVILFLLAALLFVGFRFGRHVSARARTALVFFAVALIFMFVFLRNDSLLMARLLPFSSVIVLGNPIPLLGGFLAGMVISHVSGNTWRRFIGAACLIAIALYASLGQVLGQAPTCDNYWSDSVCTQTSSSSCGAASAATLFAIHGIHATEAEMAKLCLTRESGTTMAGLYRGLKLKTAGSSLIVKPLACDFEDLQKQHYYPAILKVGLSREGVADARYEQEWGWTKGAPHTVVLFRFLENGEVEIGDPSVGRERWKKEHLETLWQGEGLLLEKR